MNILKIKPNKLNKITIDHTLVSLLVQSGELTEQEAKDHPKKNVLMKALGANDPIDIDILLFGDSRIDCPELTVPHKLMYERDFVMVPLREIAGQAGNDADE